MNEYIIEFLSNEINFNCQGLKKYLEQRGYDSRLFIYMGTRYGKLMVSGDLEKNVIESIANDPDISNFQLVM